MNHFSDLVGILLKIYSYWRSAKIDQFTQLKSQTGPNLSFWQTSSSFPHFQPVFTGYISCPGCPVSGPQWSRLRLPSITTSTGAFPELHLFHIFSCSEHSYFQFDQFIPAGSVEGTQLRVDEPLNPTLKATFNFDIGAEIHHICFLSF